MAQLTVPPPARTSLTLPHALLALAVMVVWGTNFVVIRAGLQHLPPLLFAALRFALVVFAASNVVLGTMWMWVFVRAWPGLV